MKTANARELRNHFSQIADWLERGETVLLTRRGKTVGRIIPEPATHRAAAKSRRQLFATRFAALPAAPQRDLSAIVAENSMSRALCCSRLIAS